MIEISLTSSMRANLLALQSTSILTDRTQERLATGQKVNSALDNPSSYYAARSLNNRAGDLSVLLDSMSQGIQTIKAATEGVDAGIQILEQMRSVAEQALLQPTEIVKIEDNIASPYQPAELTTRDINEFIAEGYQVITADMPFYKISDMLNKADGGKFVLADDVILTGSLATWKNNITIDGNGHTLSYKSEWGEDMLSFYGSQEVLRNINLNYCSESNDPHAAVAVFGGSLDISSVNIDCKENYTYGILAESGAQVTIDTLSSVRTDSTQKTYNVDLNNKNLFNDKNSSVYNGRANTQALLKELGANNMTATAANKFYVGSKTDTNFGQGKWYLPAIGELAEVYGIDTSQIEDNYSGTAGATGKNITLINNTLYRLAQAGVDAEELGQNDSRYWSSSECSSMYSWDLDVNDGRRYTTYSSDGLHSVRCFQHLENLSGNGPKVGDVMYTDLSYGSVTDYDSSQNKTVAGVVTWVSEDGKSAKIINLKDLRFNSSWDIDNFDPDDQDNSAYEKTTVQKFWEDQNTNVQGLADFTWYIGNTSIKVTDGSDIEKTSEFNWIEKPQNTEAYKNQFNELLDQYNELIKDCSYKGINLLNGDAFSVIFNEDMSSRLNMSGNDIRSAHIGLDPALWESLDNVKATIENVSQAVLRLRDVSMELGNSYSIIQNRKEFTTTMINVLTEGADNLTLADMNEEAANMLALQTRQQLGVKALSLSSQSARSVLSLFQR